MQGEIEGFFAECFPALGWSYEPAGRHSDIAGIREAYMRGGMFWCLFDEKKIIGTVAVRQIDETNKAAEMKRLYVLPEYQGRGYGDLLFKTAIGFAKEAGFQVIRLDTRQDRRASRHLIEKYRFRQIDQYNQNDFAELFYELVLSECGLEE